MSINRARKQHVIAPMSKGSLFFSSLDLVPRFLKNVAGQLVWGDTPLSCQPLNPANGQPCLIGINTALIRTGDKVHQQKTICLTKSALIQPTLHCWIAALMIFISSDAFLRADDALRITAAIDGEQSRPITTESYKAVNWQHYWRGRQHLQHITEGLKKLNYRP